MTYLQTVQLNNNKLKAINLEIEKDKLFFDTKKKELKKNILKNELISFTCLVVLFSILIIGLI